MKTWEKIYWGIVLGLLAFIVIIILSGKGDIRVENRITNTVSYISRGKALAYFVPFWLGFFGLIWLIAKVLTGGFRNKK